MPKSKYKTYKKSNKSKPGRNTKQDKFMKTMDKSGNDMSRMNKSMSGEAFTKKSGK